MNASSAPASAPPSPPSPAQPAESPSASAAPVADAPSALEAHYQRVRALYCKYLPALPLLAATAGQQPPLRTQLRVMRPFIIDGVETAAGRHGSLREFVRHQTHLFNQGAHSLGDELLAQGEFFPRLRATIEQFYELRRRPSNSDYWPDEHLLGVMTAAESESGPLRDLNSYAFEPRWGLPVFVMASLEACIGESLPFRKNLLNVMTRMPLPAVTTTRCEPPAALCCEPTTLSELRLSDTALTGAMFSLLTPSGYLAWWRVIIDAPAGGASPSAPRGGDGDGDGGEGEGVSGAAPAVSAPRSGATPAARDPRRGQDRQAKRPASHESQGMAKRRAPDLPAVGGSSPVAGRPDGGAVAPDMADWRAALVCGRRKVTTAHAAGCFQAMVAPYLDAQEMAGYQAQPAPKAYVKSARGSCACGTGCRPSGLHRDSGRAHRDHAGRQRFAEHHHRPTGGLPTRLSPQPAGGLDDDGARRFGAGARRRQMGRP